MPCADNYPSKSEMRANRIAKNSRSLKDISIDHNNIVNEIKLNIKNLSEISELLDKSSELVESLHARNKLLAPLLCYVMNGLDVNSRQNACNNNWDLKSWWKDHQKFDMQQRSGERV